MASLDDDHRIVLILHYWADLTLEGVADRVGWPVGTVKSRLNRALVTMRGQLGVTGVVEQHPLTRYVYPSGSDRGGERPVDAYLLEVSSWTAPAGAEGRRDPAWFSPEDAKERLAEGGREPRYAEEHGRVVDAALAQITGAGQRSS